MTTLWVQALAAPIRRGLGDSCDVSSGCVTTWLAGLLLAVAIPLLTVRYRNNHNHNKKPTDPAHGGSTRILRERSYSFTSLGMVLGVFPPHIHVPEPIITAAVFFDDDCPSITAVAEQICRPMLQYERLSTVPAPDVAGLRACNHNNNSSSSASIDPAEMVRRVVVSGPDDHSTIDQIFQYIHEPLSTRKSAKEGDDYDLLPWWEILIVENQGKGRSAFVLRLHHCLADGLSLVAVFETFATYTDASPLASSVAALSLSKNNNSATGTTTATSSTASTSSSSTNGGSNTNQTPQWRYSLWSYIRETVHVLTMGASAFDHDTAFSKSIHGKMVHSGQRTYVLFPSVSLDFIKQLKTAAAVTVNDILVCAVSQAIHDYCASQNCPVLLSKKSRLQCRALLPVAFPRTPAELQDKTTALTNKWCFVSLDMAVGCTNVLERLRTIHQSTQEIKAAPRALMQRLIQNHVAPLLPKPIGRQAVFDLFRRHSLVFSNVPGPDRPCLLAGKVAASVQMFFSNLIPQIGFLSYAGRVNGNIVLDKNEFPDIDSLAGFYGQALLQLAEELKIPAPADLVEFVVQAQQS